MKEEVYDKLKKTEEGRKKLHSLLLEEIKDKMETLTESASAQNKGDLEAIFSEALKRLEKCKNILFIYVCFASDQVKDKSFINYARYLIGLSEEDCKRLGESVSEL